MRAGWRLRRPSRTTFPLREAIIGGLGFLFAILLLLTFAVMLAVDGAR